MFCIACGFLAHGAMLFFKYTWHDDSQVLFGVPNWGEGRWLMTLLGKMLMRATSGYAYSLPLIHGFLSFVLIALSGCLSMHLLGIKQKYLRYGLAMIFVAVPVVTGTFGYMYNAPYYFLALLFSVLGVELAVKDNKCAWLAACICICFVPALYPAYIPVFLSLMLLWMIAEINKRDMEWSMFFLYGIRFVGISIIGMIMYYLATKFFLWWTGNQLTAYQGINDVGNTKLSTYVEGIKRAYQYFFFPDKMGKVSPYAYIYPMGMERIYHIILLLVGILTMFMLYRGYKSSLRKLVQSAVLVGLLPMAVHFIFVMCPSEKTNIHTLMVYEEVYFFCYAAWCMEYLLPVDLSAFAKKAAMVVNVCVLLFMGSFFIYFDNVVYLRMQLQYNNYKSDMISLVACIKSLDGYKSISPVAFVVTGLNDRSLPKYEELACTNYIIPYDEGYMYPAVHKIDLACFLKNTCGFELILADETPYLENEEVEQMPAWPDAGSIKYIGDVIVVKF